MKSEDGGNKMFITCVIQPNGHKSYSDFNIHLNKACDPLSKAFLVLVYTFGFSQFVHELTHCND